MRKTLFTAVALTLLSGWAQAQTAAALPSSPAKKELVTKVLDLQRPGIEAMGRSLAEQPAMQMMQQAGAALQRVPADKREVVAREIEADVRKYVEEAGPIVRDRAVKLAPSTIGQVLEDNFTEDELKQVLALLESPVNRKFQSLAPAMQKAITEKLVAETRASVEPKMRALEQTVARRLGVTPAAATASSPKK
jgi:uncharacterized protein